MKSKWIIHKGTRVLYANLSDFKTNSQAFKVEMDAVVEMVSQMPPNSVLGLLDVRGTVLSTQVSEVLRGGASELKSYIHKRAIVATQITGFKKIIVSGIGRFVGRAPRLFDDVEKAKDWLVSNK